MDLISLLWFIVTLAASWRIFQKMGREGWEGIIPIYNTYVYYEELYGNGWRMLLLLIPIYNIYVAYRFAQDLAASFHQSKGFGWGLFLLTPIFNCILAFGDAVYQDGSKAVHGSDAISAALDRVANSANNAGNDAAEQLKKLAELYQSGAISDEEFRQKKEELLRRM